MPVQHTAIMGESYIIATYIDGYSSQYDTPGPTSSNRSYGYFPPPPEGQQTVLYVGSSPDEMRPHFTRVRKVADGGNDASVWLQARECSRTAALVGSAGQASAPNTVAAGRARADFEQPVVADDHFARR